MLQPSRVKYRKPHRGNRRGLALRGNYIAFGEFGLQAEEAGWVTARQIEAARRVIVRYIRRSGKMWIRIFPDKPFTKKPAAPARRTDTTSLSPEYVDTASTRTAGCFLTMWAVASIPSIRGIRRSISTTSGSEDWIFFSRSVAS